MSIGGSASKAGSQSQSTSSGFDYGFGQSGTYIDPNQAPFLETLRNAAMSRFGNSEPLIADAVQTAGTVGALSLNNLTQLGNPQQVIDAQLTGLKSGLGDIFSRGMQTIGDNAIASGAFGGSRQGVAEGVLGGEIGKAFTQGYGDIIANASRQAIDASNSALAGAGQNIGNMLTGSFGGLQALAGILGDPTILSAAENVSMGGNEAQATSSSYDRKAGFSFGFGDK